jgi:transcriptional regulator with XRE-family HTH domain
LYRENIFEILHLNRMTKQELTSLKKRLGKHVQKIRSDRDMSLLDVSYNCDLDDSRISKIEQGKVNITIGTLYELAKGLEIEPTKLLEF